MGVFTLARKSLFSVDGLSFINVQPLFLLRSGTVHLHCMQFLLSVPNNTISIRMPRK